MRYGICDCSGCTARSNAKWDPVEQVKRQIAEAARVYFCGVCLVSYVTQGHLDLDNHNSCKLHLRSVPAAEINKPVIMVKHWGNVKTELNKRMTTYPSEHPKVGQKMKKSEWTIPSLGVNNL